MKFLLRLALGALGLAAAAYVIPGMSAGGPAALLLASLVLGLLNALVRPVLVLLTLPLALLSIGLFLFVINALMLLLASTLTGGIAFTGFGVALLAAVFLWLWNVAANSVIKG